MNSLIHTYIIERITLFNILTYYDSVNLRAATLQLLWHSK